VINDIFQPSVLERPLRARAFILAALTFVLASAGIAKSPVYTVSVFSTGADVSASNPEGITFDGTNIWVSWVNTAALNGTTGSSTIVEYSPVGNILATYTVPGYVEGLRYDSNSGVVWAMQNPGGDPKVTTIVPGTGIKGSSIPFAVEAATRGYANVDFSGTDIYLSYTNPVNPTDPTMQQVLSAKSPLAVGTILEYDATGTNIATGATGQPTLQNDPKCLRGTPTKGQLVMSSASDGQLIYVSNIGSETQSVSFLNVVNAVGSNVSGLNDVIYNNGTSGTFYVTDIAANEIIAITASGLSKNSLYALVGSLYAFVLVDTTDGTVLPIISNLVEPQGMIFISN
jgi:hypothetical protein